MTEQERTTPREVSDRSVGELIGEVTDKASLLVREEIELAKAEVRENISKLVGGAVVGIVAGIFVVLALIYFLHAVALFLFDVVGLPVWAGYLVVTGVLLVLGLLFAGLAYRAVKRGSPPTPKLAIEEARKTREMLGESDER